MSSTTEAGGDDTARKLSPGLSVVMQSAEVDSAPVRLTVDLDRRQHQSLKRIALELGCSASVIVRALILTLEENAEVASAVLRRIQELDAAAD